MIAAVGDLRDHALKTDLADMRVHLPAIDLEALGELDIGAVDDLLRVRLALDQRQFPQVVAIEIEQVKRDQHDLRRFALQLVLQDGEVGGAALGRDNDLAVNDRRTGSDVPGVVSNLAETPSSARVKILTTSWAT